MDNYTDYLGDDMARVLEQYEEYIELARLAEISEAEGSGYTEFYAPAPAPLTFSVRSED